LSGGTNIAFLSWVLAVIAMVSGACLLAGFLTTVFGAVSAAAIAFSFLVAPPHGIAGVFPAMTVIVVAAAVALIGPGAYSVDARLFGMREIVIARSDVPEN
jgi:uncharacterized membrane protein YphA (DoxX/SURF4 family)